MKFDNYMILDFPSKSSNEAFARSAVACFAAQMDPTLEELGDIRTAVSEAVTNCIVHAYPEGYGMITIRCRILKNSVLDIVKAFGKEWGQSIKYKIAARRAGDVAECYASTEKAERVLGWKAKRDLKKMCEDSARWQKNNPDGYTEK